MSPWQVNNIHRASVSAILLWWALHRHGIEVMWLYAIALAMAVFVRAYISGWLKYVTGTS